MALLWMEGFEGYDSVLDSRIEDEVALRYHYVSSPNTYIYAREGRVSGFAASSNSTVELWIPTDTTSDTLFVGFGIKPTSTSTVIPIRLYDSDTLGVNIRISGSTGEASIYLSSTLLGTTTNAGITVDEWSYVELKVKCHQSAGTIDVKVDGTLRLSLTDLDTQKGTHAYHDNLVIYMSSWRIDDIYFCDDTGTRNNDWMGIRQVIGLYPSGDSETVQWTPSSPTDHYSLVDEESADTSNYIESGTVEDTDLWEYGDLSGVGEIAGIQINTVCREMDAQSFLLKTPIESNDTLYDDDGLPNYTTSVKEKSRIVETDPATGSLWTISGFNSAKFGVKLA